MGKAYDSIDERWRAFIAKQKVFFVATAPSGSDGRVNVSPKGYSDTFAVLGDHQVAYLDLDGSGIETVSHLRDNGRITVMFMSFDRESKILRLYGRGRVVVPADPEWPSLIGHFGSHLGTRSIIVVNVDLIRDACGYAVPRMSEAEDREVLDNYATTEVAQAKRKRRAADGRVSLDGLHGTAPLE